MSPAHFLKSHYILNALMAIIYPIARLMPPFCRVYASTEEECELSDRETHIVMFLGVFLMLRLRKRIVSGWIEKVSDILFVCKLCNLALFFRQDLVHGSLYGVLWLIIFCLIPEPVEFVLGKVTAYRGQALEETLTQRRPHVMVVNFYAAWSPSSTRLYPVFSKLSIDYSCDNMKFGSVDVSKYDQVGKRFGVDTSITSKQLPTVVVFEAGRETHRYPPSDSRTKPELLDWTEEALIRYLNLGHFYTLAKDRPYSSAPTKNRPKTD